MNTGKNRLPQVLTILILAAAVPTACAQEAQPWVDSAAGPQYFAVRVDSLEQAIEWYSNVFGLEMAASAAADDGRWQITNLTNRFLQVELIRLSDSVRAERPLGLAKVGFHVDDVRAVAARVESATGVQPNVVDFLDLNQRILQLRDPEGNVIQLMSPLSR